MFPLNQAIANERAKVAADFKAHAREAVRSRGVSWSGMGPGEYVAPTEAEIAARAKAAVSRAQAASASPAGRFLACVVGVQKAAIAQGKDALANACEDARACNSRGLDSNVEPALRALADMEALGADVEAARRALADLMQDEAA